MFSMTTMAASTKKRVQMVRDMREIVQTVVAEIHHPESADERKRDSDAGDDGGPNIPEKCKDHENHKDDGNDERNFHVMDRSANRGGAVNGDAQMERGRNGSAE